MAVSGLGTPINRELKPGGATMAVSSQNRIEYIYRMANYKLNLQIRDQCRAFLSGLSDLIDLSWLRMFCQGELQLLLAGSTSTIDLVRTRDTGSTHSSPQSDMRTHASYDGLFATADHPAVGMFWEVVEGLGDEERRALVKFVTSCPRPPLLGFKELRPGFTIRGVPDVDRLPSAAYDSGQSYVG